MMDEWYNRGALPLNQEDMRAFVVEHLRWMAATHERAATVMGKRFESERKERVQAENDASAWRDLALESLSPVERELWDSLEWEWRGPDLDLWVAVKRMALEKGASS